MTPIPAELLAAIRAAPADGAPRLACADWLEEHGEAEWAELVRVQCAREALSGPGQQPARERLRDREAALTPVLEARLHAAVGTGRGVLAVSWERGFPRSVDWAGPLAPAFWGLLPALCLARSLRARGAGGLAWADVLAALPALPELRVLDLTLDRAESLTWAEAEPLAALPRLSAVALFPFRSNRRLLPRSVERLVDVARRGRLADAGPAARLAALRAEYNRVAVSAAGDVWAMLDHTADPTRVDLPALLSGLPALRGVMVPPWARPGLLGRPLGLRSLRVPGRRLPEPPPFGPGGDLRELEFGAEPNGVAAFADLPGLPRLRALALDAGGTTTASAHARIAECRQLRVLRLPGALPDGGRALSLPLLRELVLGGPAHLNPASVRAAFPELRFLVTWADLPAGLADAYAAAGVRLVWESPAFRETPATVASWSRWPRVAVAPGVSLTLPNWLAPAEPGPAPPEGEALAAWREWGEPDGSDDDLHFGPLLVRLERLDRPVRAPQRRALLLAAPANFPPERVGGVRTEAGDAGGRFFSLATHDANGRAALRCLWASPSACLRLTLRYGGGREAALAAVARRIAASLEWAGVPLIDSSETA